MDRSRTKIFARQYWLNGDEIFLKHACAEYLFGYVRFDIVVHSTDCVRNILSAFTSGDVIEIIHIKFKAATTN
jgi:hypothetical protein